MDSSLLQTMHTLLLQFWRFFNGFHIPGTNVTPAGLALFFIIAMVVFRFIPRILNLGAEGVSKLGRSDKPNKGGKD